MSKLLDNLSRIEARVQAACERAGRKADSVSILAVTKYAKLEQSAELLKSGRVRQIGESRVQAAAQKKAELGQDAAKASWRMIGHLQRNKARKAIEVFDALDSLDSLELAAALDRDLAEAGKTLPVLVQVNAAGTEGQSGIKPAELEGFLEGLRRFASLLPQGLMGIAPMLEPVERARPHFRELKRIFDGNFGPGSTLSMGMSRDFEIAVEEGAGMVRIGSLLFGE